MKRLRTRLVYAGLLLFCGHAAHAADVPIVKNIRNEDVYYVFDFFGLRPIPDMMKPTGWWYLYLVLGRPAKSDWDAVSDALVRQLNDKRSWLAAHVLLMWMHNPAIPKQPGEDWGGLAFTEKAGTFSLKPGQQQKIPSLWKELLAKTAK